MDSGNGVREQHQRLGIVYIMPVLETGGTQRQLRELLMALDRTRFDPVVVGFEGYASTFKSHLEATGTPVPYIDGDRREGDPAELVAAPGRAQESLGWNPDQSDLHRIVRDAVACHDLFFDAS